QRGRRRRFQRVCHEEFRNTRQAAGLTREQAADMLGVSLRTVGNWETGAARPSYAAFRLLRILRNGDLIDPAWSQFRLIRGRLVTPEEHTFEPHELTWQSLLVRLARGYGEARRQLREVEAGREAVGLGLVYSSTSDTPGAETQQRRGFSGNCSPV